MAQVERARAIVDVDGKQAGSELTNLKTRAAQLKKELIELGKANDKSGFDKKKKELTAVQKEMRGLKKDTYDATAVLKNLNGASLKDLQKAERALRQETSGLTRGTDEYIKKSKQLKTVSTEIKKVKKDMGQTSTAGANLGAAWGTAMTGMSSSTMIFTTALNSARAAVTSMSAAFRTLKGAIIGTGIGALVIALISLVQYFKRTEEGAAKLRIILAPIKVLFGNIMDILGNLGESMVDAFTQPQETIKKIGTLIKQNLINRLEAIKAIGPALAKIFKGEFKEGFEELGEASVQLATGVEEPFEKMETLAKKATEAVKDFAKETEQESAKAVDMEKRRLALQKEERRVNEENAKLRLDIAKIRLDATDKENVGADERIKLLEEGMVLEEQLLTNTLKLAKEKLALKAIENSLAQSTKEDLDEESRLREQVFTVEAQNIKERRRLATELNTARREARTEEEAAAKATAAAEAKAAEEKLKAEEKYQADRKAIREKYNLIDEAEMQEQELTLLQEGYENKLLTEEEFQEAKLSIIDKYRQLDLERDEEARAKKLEKFKDNLATQEALTEAASDLITTLQDAELKNAAGNAEKEKQIRKKYAAFEFAISVSKIISDTATSIMSALTLPPPAGEIAAGLRAATGAVQLGLATTELAKISQMATGQYPVVGADDGQTYSATYEGRASTGMVNRPSIYLAGEKGPEMIIDNPTLKNMQMNYPGLINAIQNARVPQYADGNYAQLSSPGVNGDLLQAINVLNAQLASGIRSSVAYTDIEEADSRVVAIRSNANIG